jgi:hypothetical protein
MNLNIIALIHKMKYILLMICSIILPVFSFKEMKPKLCVNCKYFIPDNNNNKFGKCSLFPVRKENDYFLVDGVSEDEIIDYHYCSTARNYDSMCGNEGKLHKRKYNKRRRPVESYDE